MFFEPQFMKKVDIRSETIGSIRVLGYTGYKGLINWIYGIVMLKFGYSVNQFFFFFCLQPILDTEYTMSLSILGVMGKNWGYFRGGPFVSTPPADPETR